MTTHINPDYKATVTTEYTWEYGTEETLGIRVGDAVLALTIQQVGQLIGELATTTHTNVRMLPTCEDCAYWTVKRGDGGYNVGECAHSKLKYAYEEDACEEGLCDVDGLKYCDVGYGEGAILEVGPSFGCVHWTRKEVGEG